MTIKELQIGDRFAPVNRPKEKWLVVGKPEFNARHGSPTRICKNYDGNKLVSKSCRLEVKKIGESPFKGKMKSENNKIK